MLSAAVVIGSLDVPLLLLLDYMRDTLGFLPLRPSGSSWQIDDIFLIFFKKTRFDISCKLQIISNLHEMSKRFLRKIFQYTVCQKFYPAC